MCRKSYQFVKFALDYSYIDFNIVVIYLLSIITKYYPKIPNLQRVQHLCVCVIKRNNLTTRTMSEEVDSMENTDTS